MQTLHQNVRGLGPAIAFQRTPCLGLSPFGQVCPGAETAATAGQHHHAYRGVSVAVIEQRMEFLQTGDVQRVALLRTIERDPGNAGFDFAQQ
ncbi:hypothetical protein D3C79_945810 [compost metagenome]